MEEVVEKRHFNMLLIVLGIVFLMLYNIYDANNRKEEQIIELQSDVKVRDNLMQDLQEEANDNISVLQNKLREKNNQLDSAEEELSKLEIELKSYEKLYNQTKLDKTEIQGRFNQLSKERSDLLTQIKKGEAKINNLEEDIYYLERDIYDKSKELDKAEDEIDDLEDYLDDFNPASDEVMADLAEAQSKFEQAVEELDLAKQNASEWKQLATDMNSTLFSLQEQMDNVLLQMEETNYSLKDLTLLYSELNESYNEMLPYYNRLIRSIEISESYHLLQDTDYMERHTADIEAFMGWSAPDPINDSKLLDLADYVDIYIVLNYNYCHDKIMYLENETTVMWLDFFSPDEIMVQIDVLPYCGGDLSNNDCACGDCDDYAMLFAGLMYTFNATDDQVSVVCSVSHCWNMLTLTNGTKIMYEPQNLNWYYDEYPSHTAIEYFNRVGYYPI